MSSFTTQLRYVCEKKAIGNPDPDDYNKVIAASRAAIFNFSYPIFDNTYKPTLETKILKHYYFREIGLETYGLWHMMLDTRMNEIMPYYNMLYQSQQLEYDPFITTDLTTTTAADTSQEGNLTREQSSKSDETVENDKSGNTTDKTTSSSEKTQSSTREDDFRKENTGTENLESQFSNTSNGTDESQASTKEGEAFSNTPQNGLESVENLEYLTTYTAKTRNDNTTGTNSSTENGTGSNTNTQNLKETNTGTQNQTATSNETGSNDNINSFEEKNATARASAMSGTQTDATTSKEVHSSNVTVKGISGNKSYAQLLMEYRQAMINIDEMIIKELSDLFMGLWQPI